jgi:hypothetical protein
VNEGDFVGGTVLKLSMTKLVGDVEGREDSLVVLLVVGS